MVHVNVKQYGGTDQKFLTACYEAGIKRPSRRQWRKWLQGRGLAYNWARSAGRL